jgi:hypothetical protein
MRNVITMKTLLRYKSRCDEHHSAMPSKSNLPIVEIAVVSPSQSVPCNDILPQPRSPKAMQSATTNFLAPPQLIAWFRVRNALPIIQASAFRSFLAHATLKVSICIPQFMIPIPCYPYGRDFHIAFAVSRSSFVAMSIVVDLTVDRYMRSSRKDDSGTLVHPSFSISTSMISYMVASRRSW